MTEYASGGIVWRQADSGVELLLVHRPRYDDWGFPKGKPQSGEVPEGTALREVEEETGFSCRLGKPLGHKEYTKPDGAQKEVGFWAMVPVSGEFRPNAEVDRIEWVPIEEASDRLTYDSDRTLLEGLPDGWTEPVPRLFLLRHAEAGSRVAWQEDDRLRPLTAQGWEQARRLVDLLGTEHVTRILTSPYVRCRQTVEPLAESLGLPIDETEDLAEDDPERSLALLGERDAVLCTHGSNVPLVLDAVLDDGCELRGPRLAAKGSTWIIDFDGALPVRARYLPPPA